MCYEREKVKNYLKENYICQIYITTKIKYGFLAY